jgi:hypothetical protein
MMTIQNAKPAANWATHHKECLQLMSNTERLDGLGQANDTLIRHIFASETHLIGIRRSRCPGHL